MYVFALSKPILGSNLTEIFCFVPQKFNQKRVLVLSTLTRAVKFWKPRALLTSSTCETSLVRLDLTTLPSELSLWDTSLGGRIQSQIATWTQKAVKKVECNNYGSSWTFEGLFQPGTPFRQHAPVQAPAEPNSTSSDGPLFYVDRIIGCARYNKRDIFYLVRWKDYSAEEDTWEPQRRVLDLEAFGKYSIDVQTRFILPSAQSRWGRRDWEVIVDPDHFRDATLEIVSLANAELTLGIDDSFDSDNDEDDLAFGRLDSEEEEEQDRLLHAAFTPDDDDE